MIDPFSYRIVLSSLGTLMVVLGVGMTGLAFLGKPIPSELATALSLLSGILSGILLPSPANGPGRPMR